MAGTNIYGQLLKAQLENLSSDPTGYTGRVYYNTTTGYVRFYNGSIWQDMGSGSGGSGRNYLSDWYNADKDPTTVAITSGITADGNITISTTAWQASDKNKLTVARTASSPLRQTYSLLLDHVATGAAFVQTPCFQLDLMDYGKPVSVTLDVSGMAGSDDYQVYMVRYNSSGTYQEQIPIAGSASATSPYSAQLPTGTSKFQGFFVAGSTTTDYYSLRFYRNDASDTTDVTIDSLYVGPDTVVQGAGVTDWVSFTPTWTGLGTTSNNTGFWRRIGDSMQVQVYVTASASGSGGALVLTVPGSYTVDSSKVADTANQGSELGNASWYDADVTDFLAMSVRYTNTTTVGFAYNSTTYDTLDGADIATGDIISAMFTVPITGWSSNVTMANRAVEEYSSNSGTWDADDTSSFAYGLSGSTLSDANLTTRRKKTVRFTTPILATDAIEVEILLNGAWVPMVGSFHGTGYSIQRFGNITDATAANSVGIGWAPVSGTSTDLDVYFGRYASATSGSTGVGWADVLNAATYWRVRKVSGGASVGYPISPSNLVKAVARYTTNAAQSITGSYAIIDFEDKSFDSRNSVTTGASWKFTAPEAGYYRAKASVLLNTGGGWAAGEYISLGIYKNGSVQSYSDVHQTATHSTYAPCQIEDIVYLQAGEYLDIRLSQNSGGNISLLNSSSYNYITVEQIA